MQDDGRLCSVRSEQSEARANETGFFKGSGGISQKRQKFSRMQEIGDGSSRSSERPGYRFRAVAFYSSVPNDFLFTRCERSQRAHHGVDGKLAGIPKPLPIAHGGGGNADYFGRAFVPQTFLKAVDGRLPLFGR